MSVRTVMTIIVTKIKAIVNPSIAPAPCVRRRRTLAQRRLCTQPIGRSLCCLHYGVDLGQLRVKMGEGKIKKESMTWIVTRNLGSVGGCAADRRQPV